MRARAAGQEHPVVLAETLIERVLGGDTRVEILERVPGRRARRGPLRAAVRFPRRASYGASSATACWSPTSSPTPRAPASSTPRSRSARTTSASASSYGLAVVNPVRGDGTYDERIGPYAGRYVKDADADLIEDLRRRGRLLRAEDYLHSYPHCWRCDTPLIYYAKPSWYIATSKIRDELLAANDAIAWHPEHIKEGRFGDWLRNNVDWALSRERYWGTPLPVWRCGQGHIHVIGSFAELEQLSGTLVDDPHRPFVDDDRLPVPAVRASR